MLSLGLNVENDRGICNPLPSLSFVWASVHVKKRGKQKLWVQFKTYHWLSNASAGWVSNTQAALYRTVFCFSATLKTSINPLRLDLLFYSSSSEMLNGKLLAKPFVQIWYLFNFVSPISTFRESKKLCKKVKAHPSGYEIKHYKWVLQQ